MSRYNFNFRFIPSLSRLLTECNNHSNRNYVDVLVTGDDPPAYLVGAVLAGLYELPPLWLLKKQIGFGRRVKHEFPPHRLNPSIPWTPLTPASPISSVRLPRRLNSTLKNFHVYRTTLKSGKILNPELETLVENCVGDDPDGMDVSNAGGYHSKPHLFEISEQFMVTFKEEVEEVIRTIETHTSTASNSPPIELDFSEVRG